MNALVFDLYKNTITKRDGFNPAGGENSYTTVTFRLKDDWQKCNLLTAMFYMNRDEVEQAQLALNDDNTASVDFPNAFQGKSGIVWMSVQGSYENDDGDTITISTNMAAINLTKGIIIKGTPDQSLYEQMVAFFNQTVKSQETVDKSFAGYTEAVDLKLDDMTELIATKADYDDVYKSKNLLSIPDTAASTTDGITVSVSDNIVTVSGTATAAVSKSITLSPSVSIAEGTAHTLSVESTEDGEQTGQCMVYLYRSTGTSSADRISMYINGSAYPDPKTVTMDAAAEYVTLKISVASGKTVSQSFRLQFEEGAEATDYASPDINVFGGKLTYNVETLMEETATLINKTEGLDDAYKITNRFDDNIVFASAFGAVGDGSTNDTYALQSAIDYCSENSKTLKLDSGKTYLISAPLKWTGQSIYFDGSFSTIKPYPETSSLSRMLLFDCSAINGYTEDSTIDSRNFRNQHVRNVIIDCGYDDADSDESCVAYRGIEINPGIKIKCENIHILNARNEGVYIKSGWESCLSNIHVCRYMSSEGGTGIYVNGSDNMFSDIVVIGCQSGVINVGGDNHYNKAHVWSTTHALSNLQNSVSFDCRGGYATFSQCMGDSTSKIFSFSNNARAMISACANTWSQSFLKNRGSGNNPYLFYFDSGHAQKGGAVTVSSCYFKPVPYGAELPDTDSTYVCYFSNLEETDNQITIDRLMQSYSEDFTYTDSSGSEQTVTLTQNWENMPDTTEMAGASIKEKEDTSNKISSSQSVTDDNAAELYPSIAYLKNYYNDIDESYNSEEIDTALSLKADYTDVYKSKNLLSIPDIAESTTNGITVTVSDNIITISGTATASATKSITLSPSIDIASTTAHTLSVESTDDGEQTGQCTVYLYRSTGTSSADRISMYINGSTYPAAKTVTMDDAVSYIKLKISVASGKTVNQTIRLQLEEGSAASDYVSPDVKVFGGKLTYDVEDLLERVTQLEAKIDELASTT